MKTVCYLVEGTILIKKLKKLKKLSRSRYDKDVVLYRFYVDFTKKGNKLEKSTRVIIKTPFLQEHSVT